MNKVFLLIVFLGVSTCSMSTFEDETRYVFSPQKLYEFSGDVVGKSERYEHSTKHIIEWFLSSNIAKLEVPTHKIYIRVSYNVKEADFYEAVDYNLQKLPFQKIGTYQVVCRNFAGSLSCGHQEVFVVEISDEFLRANNHGFIIKIRSKKGDLFEISLSDSEVQSYLAKLDNALIKQKTGAENL
ncbi:MAG: hypothetical protein WCJ33_06145 [Pseudomonadota bacterium]